MIPFSRSSVRWKSDGDAAGKVHIGFVPTETAIKHTRAAVELIELDVIARHVSFSGCCVEGGTAMHDPLVIEDEHVTWFSSYL